MSNNILKLIPVVPTYIPHKEKQDSAKKLFLSFLPEAEQISIKTFDNIMFVDQVGNFEKVLCPKCHTDISEWWFKEGMGITRKDPNQKYFDSLEITTPCCNRALSLNDLEYVWPAGFAKFVLEARNPNVKDLSKDQVKKLEEALGNKVRVIWAHY